MQEEIDSVRNQFIDGMYDTSARCAAEVHGRTSANGCPDLDNGIAFCHRVILPETAAW